MILVTATAGGLFLMNQLPSRGYDGPIPNIIIVTEWMERWITPWLSVMTLAFFVIRLRKPRPRLRVMLRQPGAIAAVLALSSLGYIGMLILGRLAVRGIRGRAILPRALEYVLRDFFSSSLFQAGPMIAGAWIALTLTGRLRRERGWIDGVGTLVGASWILIAVLGEFCSHAFL
jgi:hypothetical protein